VTAGTQLLNVTWQELADGRPHRLKAQRHFVGDLRALQEEAGAVAERMGRGILLLKDELGRNQYLWLQFADQTLIEGDACRCGNPSFVRLHERLVRCDVCAATATLRLRPPISVQRGAWRPGQRLSDYQDVDLVARDDALDDPEIERWYGHGVDPAGWNVVLQVEFALRDGERIDDPVEPGTHVHNIRRWTVDGITRAAQLGALAHWEPAAELRRAIRR